MSPLEADSVRFFGHSSFPAPRGVIPASALEPIVRHAVNPLPDFWPIRCISRPQEEWIYEPLNKAVEKATEAPVSATFATIGKLRQIPLGALLGLTVAGGVRFLRPDLSPEGWMEAPFALFCAGCGILVERAVHYGLGWLVDARLRHLAAAYEARMEMGKLRRYEKAGVLNQSDARRIAAHIAKRDVAGGPGPQGRPRGPYKKKPPASPGPSLPDPGSTPESPTT